MSAQPAAVADFLVAAGSVVDLLGRVEVVESWSAPSALPQMSVGALAAHLGSQVLTVHAALTKGTGVTQARPLSLLEHYDRVAWVRDDLDADSNRTIREGSDRAAQAGHDALVLRVQRAVEDLRLGLRSLELPPAVTMPWWDWSLSFEDYLVTRVMEMVVHSDDLAVSLDLQPPELPEEVLGPVLALLVGISLRRHGQAAVVRGLSRRERAGNISAF